ncbi:hypothetical protein [Kineosporia succinea]|uniref:Uncharacterized protein n=1 Tax=Kineosporia succinea TaxID=84632 RepID=A0ABT9PCX5_9ACTN|nr:hypothetical protein [Kineosporia succinea]MDP9830559.1 hypothetical protein [Kineosporia succinea]
MDAFLDLSVTLTGFNHFQLLGTGNAAVLRAELDQIVPADLVARLLGSTDPEATLADPDLGPPARDLVLMWYSGTWAQLPDDWRERHGAHPRDTRHVVSAEAYRGGLQWIVAGAHPAGAHQQGFGAWAMPPGALAPGTSPLAGRSVA